MAGLVKDNLRRFKQIFLTERAADKRKAALRLEIDRTPVGPDYSLDVEAKLLRAINYNYAPMLDVGANTGFYSAALEDRVGSENIYLFEPVPEVGRYLERRFRRAHVHRTALSDHGGSTEMRIPHIAGRRFDTRATLNLDVEEDNATGHEMIAVETSTLDMAADRAGLDSIGLIKIDVEGHELAVLRGGIETIRRLRPLIVIEVEERHNDGAVEEVRATLEALDYKGFFVVPLSYSIMPISEFNRVVHQDLNALNNRNFIEYINNFIFVANEMADDFFRQASDFLDGERAAAEH